METTIDNKDKDSENFCQREHSVHRLFLNKQAVWELGSDWCAPDVAELSMLLTLTVILVGGRDSCWMTLLSLFWGDAFFCSVGTKPSVPYLLLAYTRTWLQHGNLPWPGIAHQSLPECRYFPRQWNNPGFKSACPHFITTGVLFQKTNSTLESSITVIKKPP